MDNQINGNFKYQERSLLIEIPTSDPACLHELLMRDITAAMRNYITSESKDECHFTLLDLLEALQPDEGQLLGWNSKSDKTNPPYTYQERSLIIEIEASSPAAFHSFLMKAITAAMRNYITSERNDESHFALLELLESIQPNEKQLSAMNLKSSSHSKKKL